MKVKLLLFVSNGNDHETVINDETKNTKMKSRSDRLEEGPVKEPDEVLLFRN